MTISTLEEYIENRDLLDSVISELKEITLSFNLNDEIIILNDLKNKLAENIFRIIVIGEFKRGKSTFINAMLGEKVLPVGITPTTATVNVIKYGESPGVNVKYKDGTEKNIDITELNTYVTTKNREADKINTVTVYYPTELCKEQVEIIDSPGVNDIDEQRVEITYGFIPKCDAAIFLLNVTQQLSASEREFLTERVNKYVNKIFFLLNKIDQLDTIEQEEAMNYVKTELGKISDQPKIYPVSAKKALNSRLEKNDDLLSESKITEFENSLFKFLMEEKGSIILQSALQRTNSSMESVHSFIVFRLKSYQLSLEEINTRLEAAYKDFNTLENDKRHILDEIEFKKNMIIDMVNNDCKMSAYQIGEKVEKFINDSTYSNVDELKDKTIKFFETTIQEWGKKEEEVIQKEIALLLQYINLKAVSIRDKINKIKFDFIGNDSLNFDHKINMDSFAKGNDIFDFIPKFFGKEGGEFSGIARGAIFIIGASILTGGALIPAIILGSSASFFSGKLLNSWTEKKQKKELADSFKTVIESLPEKISEKMLINISDNFESNLRKKIIHELDSLINTFGKTLEMIKTEKDNKQSENDSEKLLMEEYLIKLKELENRSKEISDRL